MPIYDKPTKTLMAEWAKEHLHPGEAFSKSQVIKWFSENYPDLKTSTVALHIEKMSVNNDMRRYEPSIKPGSKHDLFFKIGPDSFRKWNPDIDPQPRYKDIIEAEISARTSRGLSSPSVELEQPLSTEEALEARREFAYERDLQNYLVKNIGAIEPGLRLYEDEGIIGVEFPAGSRYMDILAVDKGGQFVVIELKVSRGYDRVIGQLLRYMGWVKANMEPTQPVRGIIVANDITDDLRLAASHVPAVTLIEYEMEFRLKPVSAL